MQPTQYLNGEWPERLLLKRDFHSQLQILVLVSVRPPNPKPTFFCLAA